jgi:hypothetical protein
MTEDYKLMVDGKAIESVRKGGIFYPKNEHGQPDVDNPIDPGKIQEKVFVKSSIPQAPAPGYTGKGDNYSKMSLEWLKYVEKDSGRPLQTALSDEREFRITAGGQQFRIDGWDEQTSTWYEFHGVSQESQFHTWGGVGVCYYTGAKEVSLTSFVVTV